MRKAYLDGETSMMTTEGFRNEVKGSISVYMAMGQNRGTLVNIKIDGKWMFIHPNMAP